MAGAAYPAARGRALAPLSARHAHRPASAARSTRPTKATVEVSLAALRRLRLDQVWWLVSPAQPIETERARPTDLARRIARCPALVRDPRIRVTGVEATLGTTYTAETLRKLCSRAFAGVDLVWMMGADNLRHLPSLAGLAGNRRRASRSRSSTAPATPSRRSPRRPRRRSRAARLDPRGCRQARRNSSRLPGFSCPRRTSPLSSTALRAAHRSHEICVLKASPSRAYVYGAPVFSRRLERGTNN